MGLTRKRIILSILAIFVMFLPRNLSIAGMFSFRVFIIGAAVLAFWLFGIGISLKGMLKMPTFWVYIGIMTFVQLAHGEYTTMLGTLLDILVLYVVLSSCLVSKKDMDFFVRLFLTVLILYCGLCVIETLTGFNMWSSFFGVNVYDYSRFGLHRATGSYTTSLNNGVFLLMTFPLTWYAGKYFPNKKISLMAFIFVWVAIICTMSRGPILFTLLLNVIVVWRAGIIRFVKRNFVAILVVVSVFAAVMAVSSSARSATVNFLNMFISLFDSAVAEEITDEFGVNAEGTGQRLLLYSWVWQELSGHYWFGVGANTPLHHAWKTSYNVIVIKQSIENFYLATLFHYGIVGLTSLIAFLGEVSIRTFAKYKTERRKLMLKQASDSIHFRIFITLICYYGTVLTVSSVDDFKMFIILIAFAEAYHRICVVKPVTVSVQRQVSVMQRTVLSK